MTVPCSCRAWPADSRFSRRSSIHLIGAGTWRAATTTASSSRVGSTFWPKPPPVSRMITRMRCSGRPSTREHTDRTSCGACVAAQIVSSSLAASHSTTSPRVSIGTAA